MKYLCFSHENGETMDDARTVVAENPEDAATEWASLAFYGMDGSFDKIEVTIVLPGFGSSSYRSWNVLVRVLTEPTFCVTRCKEAA